MSRKPMVPGTIRLVKGPSSGVSRDDGAPAVGPVDSTRITGVGPDTNPSVPVSTTPVAASSSAAGKPTAAPSPSASTSAAVDGGGDGDGSTGGSGGAAAAGAGVGAPSADALVPPPVACKAYETPGVASDPAATPCRVAKFDRILSARAIDTTALRDLCWSGIPRQFRRHTWQLLLNYLPSNPDRHAAALERKRAEYNQCVARYFHSADVVHTAKEQKLLRDVLVDVPRTNPAVPLFHSTFVQQSFERVLFVWAVRHPASGYVQGINDLVTPFYAVFLEPYAALDSTTVAAEPATLLAVEADVYGCLTRLLDGIQDHYTPSQPGLQRMMFRLRELVFRIDEDLGKHLEDQGLRFAQFAFRWFNCLLLRELPVPLALRLWDTCLSEPGGFDSFIVYVAAALLLKFADKLKAMYALEVTMEFLQNLPTATWTVSDVEELLSQAYIYKTAFHAAPMHLQ